MVQGPADLLGKRLSVTGSRLLIGRGVDGLNDQTLSRRHSELWLADDMIRVVDLKSRNGTRINGAAIVPDDEHVLREGDLLETGALSWIFLDRHTMFARWGNLVITGRIKPAVGPLDAHRGSPLVERPKARNVGRHSEPSVIMELDSPMFRNRFTWVLPKTSPSELVELEEARPEYSLEALVEIGSGASVEVSGHVLGTQIGIEPARIQVLGWFDWLIDAYRPEDLAAHVQPGCHVARVVSEHVSDWMHSRRSAQQDGAADLEIRLAEDVFRALRERFRWHLELPAAIRLANSAGRYQRLKASQWNRDWTGPIHVTCFEISLLFAACLEALNIPPLIVLTGRSRSEPAHAFVGIRTGGSISVRREMTGERLIQEIEGQRIVCLEATAVARDDHEGGGADFVDAVEEARSHVMSAKWLIAVDVLKCRSAGIVPFPSGGH